MEDVAFDLGVRPVVDDVMEAQNGRPVSDVRQAAMRPGQGDHSPTAVAQRLALPSG